MTSHNEAENGILIRTVNFVEDYETLARIWSQAGPGIHLRKSDEPEEMLKKVRKDPELFLAAEMFGEIVGAVLGGYDGRRGLVYHLAVIKPFRRKGVARALMDELEKRLKQKGCIKYYLLVTRDNYGALRFYEQYGCEVMDLLTLGKDL
ncbi:MAG: GNAT family N-acetyltransferase [Anaerolineales bacterium]|nr:GNAT family N-acetyltransferase [Anaerolineales bacterium]